MFGSFFKTYTVKCPEGHTCTVYRNIDDALPLELKQKKSSVEGAINGLQNVNARLKASLEESIKGLLAGIDDSNRSMQANFRAAYLVYKSAPCKKLDYLQEAFDEIRTAEQRLRSVDKIIQQLASKAASMPKANRRTLRRNDGEDPPPDEVELEFFRQALDRALSALLGPPPAEALAAKMSKVAALTVAWEQP